MPRSRSTWRGSRSRRAPRGADRVRAAGPGRADRQAAAGSAARARARRHRRRPAGSLAERVSEHVDGLDGVVHGIAFAPQSALGGNFLDTPWEDVATAVHVSAYSLKALAMAALPLMGGAGHRRPGLRRDRGLARLRLDGRGQGRPGVLRPLPGAGPGPAADPGEPDGGGPAAHDGGQEHRRLRRLRGRVGGPRAAGLGHVRPRAGARGCVALLSDWFPATTGEIVHVDGGVHATGG